MRKTNLVILCVLIVMGTTMVSGQSVSRTWVSSFGDDANPCSRTAPCKTFAGAMALTVAGGEIDVLDSGSFGALTINKALTIDGGNQLASVMVTSATNGIVISAPANAVVSLRNLRVNGVGAGQHGIRFESGAALHIEYCLITAFSGNGIDIEPTAGGKVSITGTISRDNGFAGLFVSGGAYVSVSVDHSHFDFNLFGVLSGNFSHTSVKDSEASGNSSVGFIASANAGTATLFLTNSHAANNLGSGVQAGGGAVTATVRVSGVSLANNSNGFIVGVNGTIKSFGNNYNSDGGTTTQPNLVPQ